MRGDDFRSTDGRRVPWHSYGMRMLSGSPSMDACHTRTWPVPTLLAQLNSTVLILMDRVGVRNVARQMRYFDAHPDQALAFVLTGPVPSLRR